MSSEESGPYKFIFTGGYDNVYEFSTIDRVRYIIRFKPNADYVSVDEYWRNEFYELMIEVASAPDSTRVPADRLVFPTIAIIIANFFAIHERVILYICDDSDSRELARKRKFDGWYNRLGSGGFIKHDLPTVTTGTDRYYASVFFRRDNPYRDAIIDAFERFGSGEK